MGDASPIRPSHLSLTPAENVPKALILLAKMLHQGAYDQILTLLKQQNNTLWGDKESMATVQTAAEQICRSCLQLQSVAHVHAQAQTDLANQEKALRRELWNLLQRFLVPEEDLLDLDELLAAMNALPATQTNWLHRVKSFFQRKPALPQPIQAPGVAAELAPAAKLLTEQLPMLDVYCLGTFRVYNNDALIAKWPGVKCQSIFKYMIFHRERPAPLEVLMDLFWREDEPEAARRNLYQAIYLLRQALQESAPAFNYVVSADGCYGFNSELNIWLDAEDFERLYENGRRHAREGNIETAVAAYESAAALYNGPFFAEDLYEAWMQPPRERLHRHNLNLLEQLSRHYFNAQQFALSISYARKIVTEDSCHEAAHRLLMTAYAHRGQRHLALRQYHQCAEALQAELDAVPSPETAVLHEKIKKNQLQF